MPLKDIRTEFTSAVSAHVSSTALFSHRVFRGTLKGSAKTWIKKEMPDPAVAKIELLAQEFFRLIIPHQSETRLLRDSVTGTHHILSEEVRGYRDLPYDEAENFGNGHYTGLGQVLVTAMFLQEIDLKNGNLGLDHQGRVAKIDGDWCFAEGRFGTGEYKLTPKAIARLPYATDFYVFNWLDATTSGTHRLNGRIVNFQLSTAPQFRAEVNQAMLMISLLPDSFIERFVDAYIPAGGETFIKLIKKRRQELLTSALQNESFKAYLISPQAEIDATNLIAHMNSFQANDAGPVVPVNACATTTEEVRANLAQLKYQLIQSELRTDKPSEENSEERTLMKDNDELLKKLLSYQVNSADKILKDYVAQTRNDLMRYQKNPKELEKIKEKLIKTLKSVSSAEVAAVKAAAQSFRDNTHWYTVGKTAKARRIEEALCNTPLELRGNVISQEGPANKVQEVLASHRHWGKSGKVYKKGEQIDMQEAATTYKRLIAEFSNTNEDHSKHSDLTKPLLK